MKKLLVKLSVFAALAMGLASLAINAHAQLARNFPPDSKLGELTAMQYPVVEISGQTLRLGAGGQIRGRNNLIILPAMLTEAGSIRYQIDTTGNVHRIWLLTPEEVVRSQEEAKNKSNSKQ